MKLFSSLSTALPIAAAVLSAVMVPAWSEAQQLPANATVYAAGLAWTMHEGIDFRGHAPEYLDLSISMLRRDVDARR